MVNVTAASTWMRLPGLIAGLVTWLILSREVLPRLGVKINNRQVAHWTTAAMFELFWMVYNNGTRPEPVIAVFAILTWVSFERAIATRRLLPAAVGTILAALALGAGPTGLIAVAAMLASLGVLIR
ncbi:arabinosyltransferase domain-containing protein, partial [Kocuria tytonicola]|uniref:arabinosyltransferase domain-containing protein n=1 Tax=Kocuria tytonicola TaxID=2055946 RepID=UPI001F0C5164